MRQPLRILLVEDSPGDAELLLRELRKAGHLIHSERVCTAEDMQAALERSTWDVVISDYVMPGFSGMESLEIFKKRNLEIPFIIVSGHIGEEIAVAALQAGADDYIMKDRLVRTSAAIEAALQRWEMRRARTAAEEALRKSESELRVANLGLLEAREQLEARVADRTKALTRANRELECHIAERRRLENELLEIAEAERRRTGFDLHDDLGQRLAGVSMLLAAVQTTLERKGVPEAAETAKARDLIADIISYTHDLADCFGGFQIEGVEFPVLVRKLVTQVRKTFGTACRVRSSGLFPRMQPETVVQLYKIVQECVHHAIRRCKAEVVIISIDSTEKQFVLEVSNNGVPFETDSDNQLAFRTMNYRARLIGANLEVRTNGDSGTFVKCVLPLQPPGGEADSTSNPASASSEPALSISAGQ